MPDVTARKKTEALMIPFFRPHLGHLSSSIVPGVSVDDTDAVRQAYEEKAYVLFKWHDDTGPEPDKVSCLPLADGSRDYVWCEAHWHSGRSEYFLIVCRDSVGWEFELLRLNISVRPSSITPTLAIHPTSRSFQLFVSIDCVTLPKVLLPRTVVGPRHRFCLSRTWRCIVHRGQGPFVMLMLYIKKLEWCRRVRFVTDDRFFENQSGGFSLLREAWERSDRQSPQNDPKVVVSSRLMVACQQCVDCYDMFRCWCCEDCGHCTNCTNCTDCSRCQECTRCTSCFGCVECIRSRDCAECEDCRDCVGCTSCESCSNCAYCKNCVDCTDCVGCDGLTGVTGWWRNLDPSGMQLVLYSPVRYSN
jgi:hypothetical protein